MCEASNGGFLWPWQKFNIIVNSDCDSKDWVLFQWKTLFCWTDYIGGKHQTVLFFSACLCTLLQNEALVCKSLSAETQHLSRHLPQTKPNIDGDLFPQFSIFCVVFSFPVLCANCYCVSRLSIPDCHFSYL